MKGYCAVMERAQMTEQGPDLIPELSPTDHVRGSLDAPAVITEFGDFECPYCGVAYGVLNAVLEYGPSAALAFRHYPLPMHPHAVAAAEAAEAAASVGKFWPMYDELYRHQGALRNSICAPMPKRSASARMSFQCDRWERLRGTHRPRPILGRC